MGDSELTVQLTLTAVPTAARMPVLVSREDTPSSFRKKVAEATKIPIGSLRLIFRGRLISDDETKHVVDEFKLEQDSVVHCMGKPVESAAAPTQSASSGSGATMTLSSAPVAEASTAASSSTDPLQSALTKMRASNTPSVYLTAVTTLEKMLNNIASHPMEEKYRKVKRQNSAFQKRLGGLVGGNDLMLAAGFDIESVDGEDCYLIKPSPDAWPKLMATKAAVSAAVTEATLAATHSVAPSPSINRSQMGLPTGSGSGSVGSGIPPFGVGGGMGGGIPQLSPQMQQMATQMMSDPSQLQAMLQNPMVQNMLRGDPRFANNPMLQQSLTQMVNNPEMLQQISAMMRDPIMQAQMQNMAGQANMMEQGAGGFGGVSFPMSGSGAPASSGGAMSSSSSPADSGSSNQSGQTDQEMSEEEMLQEAIRRSLRES